MNDELKNEILTNFNLNKSRNTNIMIFVPLLVFSMTILLTENLINSSIRLYQWLLCEQAFIIVHNTIIVFFHLIININILICF